MTQPPPLPPQGRPQPLTPQPATQQSSTPQSSTPQSSTPQPPTPQSSTPQPPTPQSSTPPPVPSEPAPAPPTAADRAQHHVTEQTRTYPCGSCGAPLVFAPDQQNLACLSCGRTYPIELDAQARIVKHDLRTAMAAIAAGAVGLASVGGNEHEVVCQSCGGTTVFNGSLTATRCPYCATPIQRDDVQDSSARFPLDAIVPLHIGEAQARESIESWINSRWFAPREFKKYRTLGSFTSVYLSYYSYDADTTTSYHGQRGDTYTVTVGSGDNRHTETRIRWRPRSGVVRDRVRDLPEVANTGMDAKRIRDLEPWPIQAAVPYTPEFVAGHFSRTYDLDPQNVFTNAAQPRIDSQIESSIRRDIGGDHQRISSRSTAYDLLQFMYLLLPMWLLTVNYDGRPFQVMVNGLTGEVQGERPWSTVKIAAASILGLIVIGVIAYFIWRSQ